MAIAIPVFTTQLEKSKEATDMANLRGAYAAATIAALNGKVGTNAIDDSTQYYYNPSSDGSIDTTGVELGKGTAVNGQADVGSLPTVCAYTNTDDVNGYKISIKFSNGTVTECKFVSGT